MYLQVYILFIGMINHDRVVLSNSKTFNKLYNLRELKHYELNKRGNKKSVNFKRKIIYNTIIKRILITIKVIL